MKRLAFSTDHPVTWRTVWEDKSPPVVGTTGETTVTRTDLDQGRTETCGLISWGLLQPLVFAPLFHTDSGTRLKLLEEQEAKKPLFRRPSERCLACRYLYNTTSHDTQQTLPSSQADLGAI